MTKTEYQNYQKSVEQFLTKNSIAACGPEKEEQEPFFSWSPCGCCGSTLGGSREEYVFCVSGEPEKDFTEEICQDCVYYLEYGRLDDLTMLEMEKNSN